MRKTSAIIGVLVVVALLLSACGPTAPAPATAAPTAAPKPPAAATAAPPAAAATTAPAAAATPAAAKPAATGKQLVLAMDLDLLTLDPARAFSDAYLIIGKAMYDQLTDIDPKDPSKLIPQLAEKWTISTDGLVYTFNLRKGVKFPSGREMTSADVKFSLERLMNVKGSPSFMMDGVKSVATPDPYTVSFTLGEPDSSFLARTSGIYMAMIDTKEAQAQGATNAADAEKTDKGDPWLSDHSIGTGPYMLDKWSRNAEVRLVPNPNSWRGAPKFDSIVVKQVKDATSQAQMLQRGDVDFAMNIDPDTAKQLKSVNTVTMFQGLSPSIIYVGMTSIPTVSPIVSKKEFRQAVAWSIDYDGLDNQVLSGNAVTPPSVIWQGALGWDSAPAFKRDLTKAKDLLAKAGYTAGTKIPVPYPNQTIFGIDLNIVMQKLQSDLAGAGVTLELQPREFSVWATDYRGQKTAFTIGYQTPDFPDPHANTDAFGSSTGVFAKRMGVSTDNDALVKKGTQVTDPKERAAVYGQLLKQMQDQANFLALIQPKEIIAYRGDRIKDYVYHPVVKVMLDQVSKN